MATRASQKLEEPCDRQRLFFNYTWKITQINTDGSEQDLISMEQIEKTLKGAPNF